MQGGGGPLMADQGLGGDTGSTSMAQGTFVDGSGGSGGGSDNGGGGYGDGGYGVDVPLGAIEGALLQVLADRGLVCDPSTQLVSGPAVVCRGPLVTPAVKSLCQLCEGDRGSLLNTATTFWWCSFFAPGLLV